MVYYSILQYYSTSYSTSCSTLFFWIIIVNIGFIYKPIIVVNIGSLLELVYHDSTTTGTTHHHSRSPAASFCQVQTARRTRRAPPRRWRKTWQSRSWVEKTHRCLMDLMVVYGCLIGFWRMKHWILINDLRFLWLLWWILMNFDGFSWIFIGINADLSTKMAE